MAREYAEAGISTFALPYGVKWDDAPWESWQYRQATKAEHRGMFPGDEPRNVAVAHGPASGNLACLDADSAQRYAEGLAVFTGLGFQTWIVRRPPAEGEWSHHNGGGKFYIRTPELAQSVPGTGREHLQVLTWGYSLVPDSRHPDGGDYYTEAGIRHVIARYDHYIKEARLEQASALYKLEVKENER